MDSRLVWVQKYQAFIYKNILPKIVPPNDITNRRKLVELEPMKMWIRAVTDRSFNPNQLENYESLEYLGDLEMATQFSAMVINKHPDIDEKTLTYLKNNKVWKHEQAKLSDSLGLPKFIRTIFPISISKKEDLLEALFGALRILGDKYIGVGQGSILTYNMIVYLYGDIIINFDILKLKNAKEQFKEIADKLSWFEGKKSIEMFGNMIEILDPKTSALVGYRLVYSLNILAKQWLTSHGKQIKNNGLLADVTGADKTIVESQAAIDAINTLKQLYDLDWNVADKIKTEQTEVKKSTALIRRMKEDNYIDFNIQDNRGNINDPVQQYIIQLIGLKSDGTKEIVLTVIKEINIAHKALIRTLYDLYIQRGKQPLGIIISIK